MLSVVLVQPLIPQNAGNIARLTAATGCDLHLIEPLGFSLDDRYLKRAGLDYWPEVNLKIHPTWEDYLQVSGITPEQMWVYSTHATAHHYDQPYRPGHVLVFGNESHGLANEFHQRYADRRVKLPMSNKNVRSLNLSNAVAVAIYEGLRMIKTLG